MLRFLRSLLTTSMMTSAVFLVLGLLFIFYPGASLMVLANIVATMLIIYGVYGLILSLQSISVTYSLNIGTSVIALVLGSVVLMNNNILAALIPVILGLFFIVNSTTKLRYALVLKNQGKAWLAPMIIALALLALGVVMLAHPIFSAITLTTFIGIVMVAYAVVDLVDAAFLKRDLKTIEDYMKGRRRRPAGERKNRGERDTSGIAEAEVVDKNKKV